MNYSAFNFELIIQSYFLLFKALLEFHVFSFLCLCVFRQFYLFVYLEKKVDAQTLSASLFREDFERQPSPPDKSWRVTKILQQSSLILFVLNLFFNPFSHHFSEEDFERQPPPTKVGASQKYCSSRLGLIWTFGRNRQNL